MMRGPRAAAAKADGSLELSEARLQAWPQVLVLTAVVTVFFRASGKGSRKPRGAGDNCAGVAAGTQVGCKRIVGDDMGQAERPADNKNSGDDSSGGSESECD